MRAIDFLTPMVLAVLMFTAEVSADAGHSKSGNVSNHSDANKRLSYGAGCIVGNCETGYGYYIFEDGEIDIGKWSFGKNNLYWLNGPGLISMANYYAAGRWSDGMIRFGLEYYYDHSYHYLGDFGEKNGRWYYNGLGARFMSDGSIQYGSFDYDTFAGDGCQVYYGAQYRQSNRILLPGVEGDVSSSCEGICSDGIGKKTYSDGTFYIGDFAGGKANGFGVTVYANGTVFAGRWKDHGTVAGYYYDGVDASEQAVTDLGTRQYRYVKNGYMYVYNNWEYAGEYCSLRESSVQQMLSSSSFAVDGLFFRYGDDAFDWIYVEKNGAYAAKLKGANSSGFFDWEYLHTSTEKGFDYINVSGDGKTVSFGPAK